VLFAVASLLDDKKAIAIESKRNNLMLLKFGQSLLLFLVYSLLLYLILWFCSEPGADLLAYCYCSVTAVAATRNFNKAGAPSHMRPRYDRLIAHESKRHKTKLRQQL